MNFHQRIHDICGNVRHADVMYQDVVRLLRHTIKHYNWVGIYVVEGTDLVLTAWDGPAETQHVRIPIGQGICGLAAREAKTVIVEDVNKDPRYLQCFLNTKPEIAVPIFKKGKVVGEIDIDSDTVGAFNDTDRILLEWVAEQIANATA